MAVTPAHPPVGVRLEWSTRTPAAFRNGGSVLGTLLGTVKVGGPRLG
ncbi:hypothetical protein ABTY96_42315 [Streptomyces sp. NPDC096057]